MKSVVENGSDVSQQPSAHELDEVIHSRPVHRVADSKAKRALDVLLGGFMLILGSPVFGLVAAAIKLDDRGPVLYRQKRWGTHRRPFHVLKFRTMVPDSDAKYGIKPADEDDDRITRVGRVLRKMGLDELPQIINIVRGEMSFVGPRPLAQHEEVYIDGKRAEYEDLPGFEERLLARPGLTGPATVYIPKDSSPVLKFEHDLAYVRDWSLWTDIKLIVLSFIISFRGNWETRTDKIGL